MGEEEKRKNSQKLLYCFEDVLAVVYVVSLDNYDLFMNNDNNNDNNNNNDDNNNDNNNITKMEHSMVVFEEIVNSKWLQNRPIILLFTGGGVLKEKIMKIDMKSYFEDYDGFFFFFFFYFYYYFYYYYYYYFSSSSTSSSYFSFSFSSSSSYYYSSFSYSY